MYISRIIIRNFRNFEHLDVSISSGVTCLVGENNTGKSNLIFGIRLALDAGLSSNYRSLDEQDFHCGADITDPNQAIVSIEFSDYYDSDPATALVGSWEFDQENRKARLTYRFRPKREFIELKEREEPIPTNLTLDDYHWELTGGGQNDPSEVQWYEHLGHSVRFSDLQQFQVVFLPALRDVRHDLRQSRTSPLGRLLDSSAIPEDEKDSLVNILREANEAISERPTIADAGNAIDGEFRKTAGEAFQMNVRLGMADPSFSSIARSLTILLSNDALRDFEPYRNGLGLNNILYVSMLMETFERRVRSKKCAGQLLFVEEPEAHLHPQLQRVLFSSLKSKPFQTILSSHSTHITSAANLDSVVVLTNQGNPATIGTTPYRNGILEDPEVADLERYLDATRSTILYTRKVILVEGPAELFLIPPLVKHVLNIDLERHGVSVVPIYGIHFDVYAKLFNNMGMPKKCAIVADGDLIPSDSNILNEEESLQPPELEPLCSEFVEVFRCSTTFERAVTLKGTLKMLASATEELGATRVTKKLKDGFTELSSKGIKSIQKKKILKPLRDSVLNTAKRFGKARFAQVTSKYVNKAEIVPKYIRDAIEWLEL
ncbi:ATP-dependent endonuclease [candidate division KSB1 bacterium]